MGGEVLEGVEELHRVTIWDVEGGRVVEVTREAKFFTVEESSRAEVQAIFDG